MVESTLHENQQRCQISDALNSLAGVTIHPAFRWWLLEAPVAATFSEKIEDLKKLMTAGTFVYSKLDLADKDSAYGLVDFVDETKIVVRNLLRLNLSSNNGYCSELAYKALRLIRAKYPDLTAIFFEGKSPGFSRHNYNHFFLVVFDGHVVDEDMKKIHVNGNFGDFPVGNFYYRSSDLSAAVDLYRSGWIVDPSYGRVIPVKDSGYAFVSARDDRHISQFGGDMVTKLEPGSMDHVPLGFGETTGNFLELCLCPKNRGVYLRLSGDNLVSVLLPYDSTAWEHHFRQDRNLLFFWTKFVTNFSLVQPYSQPL